MDAVLFDLDGTLLDTHRLYATAYHNAFIDVLDEPPSFQDFVARRPASERIFLVEWFGEAVGDRIHQSMLEHYEANAATLLDGLFVGVGAMLDAIHERGLATAIVTGKSRRAYEVTCRHVDLSRFEVVVVEDDVSAAKPDPAGIVRAHAAIGGGEAVYVGDTPMDVEAAKRAGMVAAAALWARGPKERERAAGHLDETVWVLREPADLLARLG